MTPAERYRAKQRQRADLAAKSLTPRMITVGLDEDPTQRLSQTTRELVRSMPTAGVQVVPIPEYCRRLARRMIGESMGAPALTGLSDDHATIQRGLRDDAELRLRIIFRRERLSDGNRQFHLIVVDLASVDTRKRREGTELISAPPDPRAEPELLAAFFKGLRVALAFEEVTLAGGARMMVRHYRVGANEAWEMVEAGQPAAAAGPNLDLKAAAQESSSGATEGA